MYYICIHSTNSSSLAVLSLSRLENTDQLQAHDARFYRCGVFKLGVLGCKGSSSFQSDHPSLHRLRVSGGYSLISVKSSSQHLEATAAAALWLALHREIKLRNHWHERYRRAGPQSGASVMCFCCLIDGTRRRCAVCVWAIMQLNE